MYTGPPDVIPELGWERSLPAAVRPGGVRPDDADAHAGPEPGFADLLDIINPLQHIPVVSTLYRRLTGDEIGAGARVAGGLLYGGIVGLAAAAFDALIERDTGQDMGEHMLAMLGAEPVQPPLPATGAMLAEAAAPVPGATAASATAAAMPAAADTAAPVPPAAPTALPAVLNLAAEPAAGRRTAMPAAAAMMGPARLPETIPAAARADGSYLRALELAERLRSYYQPSLRR